MRTKDALCRLTCRLRRIGALVDEAAGDADQVAVAVGIMENATTQPMDARIQLSHAGRDARRLGWKVQAALEELREMQLTAAAGITPGEQHQYDEALALAQRGVELVQSIEKEAVESVHRAMRVLR